MLTDEAPLCLAFGEFFVDSQCTKLREAAQQGLLDYKMLDDTYTCSMCLGIILHSILS